MSLFYYFRAKSQLRPNDGVCDDNDCDNSDFNIGAKKPIGTPCDDGDFNTKNDVYTDGCICQGEPIDTTNTGGGTNTDTTTLWTLSTDGNYIYREGKTMTAEFWADKLMVEANLSTNNLFEGSNQIMPLEQLRGYIEQNKHLPNIPKAATVVNSGLNIGLLSVLRMEKIKELTLYLLEMNERLEELEEENKGLEQIENDCNSVTASGGSNGTVSINNIPAGAKVEISGPSTGWGEQLVCNGNCNPNEIVDNLSDGNYTVTIQTFNPYCWNRHSDIPVDNTGGGNSNPCDGQGGDTDGDGVCDNQDNCDNTPNADQTDDDGDGVGDACDNCINDSNANQADGDGNGTGDACENGGGSSGEGTTIEECTTGVSIEYGNGSISVTGQSGTEYFFTIFEGPNIWGTDVGKCTNACGHTFEVNNLANGEYTVWVRDANWNELCSLTINLTSGGGGNNGGGNTQQDTTTVGLWTVNNTDNYIYRDGKVMVMDTFMAEKIIVEVLNFPDYVFEADYNLMPLHKLQQYIITNKHLPNIPKGATIEKEGMNIGDISVLQMEKIEELTLYLLEMNERLKRLEEANQQLKSIKKK